MRVLVTGADGFVGEHVIRALLRRGADVVGAVRGPQPVLRTLSPEDTARVRWITFELGDDASVAALVADADPHGVIHLAGLSSVARSWAAPRETWEINATGALRLAQALRAAGPAPGGGRASAADLASGEDAAASGGDAAASAADAASASAPRRLLLAGSAEAYGRTAGDGHRLVETDPLAPLSPYGASKAAQEMIGFSMGVDPALSVVQTRSFQHTGAGQHPPFVFAEWAAALVQAAPDGGGEVRLRVGDIAIERDVSDVRDVAEAYVALLVSDAEGVFNVCSGRKHSLAHALDLLADIIGVHVDPVRDEGLARPADIRCLWGGHEKLTAATGWEPRYGLREGLEALVESL